MLNDHIDDIVLGMAKDTSPRLLTYEEFQARAFERHPEERAAWDAEVLARVFSHAVLAYRIDHDLSQAALGRLLGVPQSQIARIEEGDHTPTFATLLRYCDALGLEAQITIAPRGDKRPAVPRSGRGVADASDQATVAIRPARRRRSARD